MASDAANRSMKVEADQPPMTWPLAVAKGAHYLAEGERLTVHQHQLFMLSAATGDRPASPEEKL